MAQSYTLHTQKAADETMRDLRESFDKWGYHLGARVAWAEMGSRRDIEAVIEFTLPGQQPVTIRHKRQENYKSNLRVLYLAVEAMRMNDVRGITDILREAYLMLPPPATVRDPFEVLGVRPDAPREVIEASYKALAKSAHPDAGGSVEAMAELNAAREAVLR